MLLTLHSQKKETQNQSLVCFTVEDELPDLKQDSDLPIIPNYLANPPFPYVYNTSSTSIPDPALNGDVSHLEPQDTNSPCVPDLGTYRPARAPQLEPGNAAPPNGDIPALPRGSAGPAHPNPVLQRAPVYQGLVSWGRGPSSPAGSNQSLPQPLPQQGSSSSVGPVPAFQPLFFTGAFPLNMQGNTKNLVWFCVDILSPWAVQTNHVFPETFRLPSWGIQETFEGNEVGRYPVSVELLLKYWCKHLLSQLL